MRDTADRLQRLSRADSFITAVDGAAALLTAAFEQRRTVFSCGNGGSLCDAMHFAEELTGRFRDDRPALPAVAITDPGHMTCVSNDFGYEQIYARYLQAHARPGDVLVALSTSGTSRNIVAAADAMREAGGSIVALTGRPGSPLGRLADVDICAQTEKYADRAQEVHIVVLHSLVQMVEERLFMAGGVPVT